MIQPNICKKDDIPCTHIYFMKVFQLKFAYEQGIRQSFRNYRREKFVKTHLT